jgi:hypothetical protein
MHREENEQRAAKIKAAAEAVWTKAKDAAAGAREEQAAARARVLEEEPAAKGLEEETAAKAQTRAGAGEAPIVWRGATQYAQAERARGAICRLLHTIGTSPVPACHDTC